MEKKMVHRLLSLLTHATSIDQDNVALPEIFHIKKAAFEGVN
jgi:hypothetical protein